MADIHSHVLFAVDDGAESKQISLKMLQQAERAGIQYLVASPHATDLTNDQISHQFIEHFQQLQQMVKDEGFAVHLSLASELYFNVHIYDLLKYSWARIGEQGKYLLFELPLYEMPRKVSQFIFHCNLQGITPILAHPERYGYLRKNISKILEWQHQGCLMQINAGSILGHFGERTRILALKMVRANVANIIASDAHDPEHRSYDALREAQHVLAEEISLEKQRELFFENPKKVILGESIEPGEVDESEFHYTMYSIKWFLDNLRKVFHI